MDHVVIQVRGGVVQSVVSTRRFDNVDFHVIDWDDFMDGVGAPEDVLPFMVEDDDQDWDIDPDRFSFEVLF